MCSGMAGMPERGLRPSSGWNALRDVEIEVFGGLLGTQSFSDHHLCSCAPKGCSVWWDSWQVLFLISIAFPHWWEHWVGSGTTGNRDHKHQGHHLEPYVWKEKEVPRSPEGLCSTCPSLFPRFALGAERLGNASDSCPNFGKGARIPVMLAGLREEMLFVSCAHGIARSNYSGCEDHTSQGLLITGELPFRLNLFSDRSSRNFCELLKEISWRVNFEDKGTGLKVHRNKINQKVSEIVKRKTHR